MQIDLDSWRPELKRIKYPEQMQFVDRGINGSGFYPGARECFFGDSSSPRVMILGRDFGSKKYYDGLAAQPGRSEYALTWRHTVGMHLSSLREFNVFCTNYLMGVRVDGSAKGDIRERMAPIDWQTFEASCWSFLQFQIEQVQPLVMLVCGADNKRDLDNSSRLKGTPVDVVYGPHPHSAIGVRNRSKHLQVLSHVRHRVRLAVGLK